MLTLAIETSSEVGGVCLFDSHRGLLAEARFGSQRRHSASIVPSIQHMLRLTSLNIRDVDFFSISIGPGSFTGLRVGLSTVKGLCFSTGKPVVALSSLEAFAHQFIHSSYTICPLFDARKKEVYGALFRAQGGEIERLTEDSVSPVERIISMIKDKTLFAGTGTERYRDVIKRELSDMAVFAEGALMHPLPSALAWASMKKAQRGEFSDPATLTPLYIRPSEAELKRQG